MRRRLALLMATVLCMTSVPQVSLVGMAAEETELTGSMEAAEEIELQSAENPEVVVEPEAAEAADVQETLAAEVETATTETATTETTQSENAQTETTQTETTQETETVPEETQTTEVVPQEPQTESETPEATETPQETEPSVVEPETKETEIVTEVTETETETEEATEAETENGIAVQSDEGHEVESLSVDSFCPLYVAEETYSNQDRRFMVEFTYADGSQRSLNALSKSDFYDHSIVKEIYKSDGTETPYTLESDLAKIETGDYYLKVTCGGKTATRSFKVVSLEEMKDSAQELKMGSNSVMLGHDNFYLYHFKMGENKKLIWQGESTGRFYLSERRVDDGITEWRGRATGIWDTAGMYYYEDEDYYFYSYSTSMEDISSELTIIENPTIVKIENAGSQEFLQNLQYPSLKVNLYYADQPTQTLYISHSVENDNYLNYFNCKILDKDGKEQETLRATCL